MGEGTTNGLFAGILRKYRESTGMSRNRLAEVLGLDGSYVYRLEKGDRRPSRRVILAIADTLGLEGKTVNEWLAAAGHGPLPPLPEARSTFTLGQYELASRSRSSQTSLKAARWGMQLERMGFEEPVLVRLMQRMETATTAERQRAASIISQTLRRVVNDLEVPVRKAIIPVAGNKHRSLAPHAVQRLLTLAIAEAAECGIHEIVLVLAPGTKDSFYTPLKDVLDLAIGPLITLRDCVQVKQDGLGDALLQASTIIGEEPFAVILPDDVLEQGTHRGGETPELRLMIDAVSETGSANLIAVTAVSKRKMLNYGIVEVSTGSNTHSTRAINRLIEKPEPGHPILRSPNALSIVGRYVLQPEIFRALRELKKQGPPPLELTTAIESLRKSNHEVRAFLLKGERRDFGEVMAQANDLIDG